jgi:hypothetical protein
VSHIFLRQKDTLKITYTNKMVVQRDIVRGKVGFRTARSIHTVNLRKVRIFQAIRAPLRAFRKIITSDRRSMFRHRTQLTVVPNRGGVSFMRMGSTHMLQGSQECSSQLKFNLRTGHRIKIVKRLLHGSMMGARISNQLSFNSYKKELF